MAPRVVGTSIPAVLWLAFACAGTEEAVEGPQSRRLELLNSSDAPRDEQSLKNCACGRGCTAWKQRVAALDLLVQRNVVLGDSELSLLVPPDDMYGEYVAMLRMQYLMMLLVHARSDPMSDINTLQRTLRGGLDALAMTSAVDELVELACYELMRCGVSGVDKLVETCDSERQSLVRAVIRKYRPAESFLRQALSKHAPGPTLTETSRKAVERWLSDL
jgi:hypothetical protein